MGRIAGAFGRVGGKEGAGEDRGGSPRSSSQHEHLPAGKSSGWMLRFVLSVASAILQQKSFLETSSTEKSRNIP